MRLVSLNRRFPFDIPDQHCNAVLSRYSQNQVDMIRHRVSFDKLDLFLPTQLPHSLTDSFAHLTKENFSPVLGDDNNVVFALPFHMG